MTLMTADQAASLDDVRARFRAYGLVEIAAGTSYFYSLPGSAGRLLLILQSVGRGAQIYLYPEAFARPAGAAQWFYATLEAEGFAIGSKLGPSIGLDVTDGERMDAFWVAFTSLLAGETPTGEVAS